MLKECLQSRLYIAVLTTEEYNEPVRIYTEIENNTEIFSLLDKWKSENIKKIAVDFEGEFNLHCYGEHLCLIQIFDSNKFYLIDPLKVQKSVISALLENKEIEKLWFSVSSDAALVWKKYGIKICNVRDLALEAKILGIEGGLSTICKKIIPDYKEDSTNTKKHNQKTNWMHRPLSPLQIDYALSDVEYLFMLQERLDKIAEMQDKKKETESALKKEVHVNENPIPGYKKLPGYKRLSREQKIYIKHFYFAREKTAETLDKPPFMVLDKHILTKLAVKAPQDKPVLAVEIRNKNKKTEELLLKALLEAGKEAEEEIKGLNSTRQGKHSLQQDR